MNVAFKERDGTGAVTEVLIIFVHINFFGLTNCTLSL